MGSNMENKASILALFNIINEIDKGYNLEYIIAKSKLLKENPYLLSEDQVYDYLNKYYFSHDTDMRIMFSIIVKSLRKNTSNLIKFLPNLILVLQKKKQVELNRKQNLDKYVSKATIITTLLAISLGIIIYISMNLILKNQTLVHVIGLKENQNIMDFVLIIGDIFISIITGASLMLILFNSLSEKEVVSTLIIRLLLIIAALLTSYVIMMLIM